MTLNPNEQFASNNVSALLRCEATRIMPKKFAAGVGTLALLTPVAYNTSTNDWQVWGDPVASSVFSLTAASTTATDGTFTLTVDGEETAAIDHDASAATIATALAALDGLVAGDIETYTSGSGLGTNNGIVYIVFKNKTPGVSLDTTSLTGNAHVLATVASDVGEISTVTANATPASDGTFTLTVNSETTSAIAHDATAATIQTALEALGGIGVGDVTVLAFGGGLGTGSGGIVVLFRGSLTYTNPTVSIGVGSLTGNAHVLATVEAGGSANGTNVIRGFVWPDAITLDSDEEVLGNVMLAGIVHYADIPLPSGESTASLQAALRSGVRELGITVQGLSQVR
jgi:hypothetical protein